MLIDFTVGNYLSFRDQACFSLMTARSVKEHAGLEDPADDHTVPLPTGDLRLLKCAAIYGANGSGKSNLLRSVAHMRQAVLGSSQSDTLMKELSERRFLFEAQSASQPSVFEMTFLESDVCYRYGFEFLNGTVASEWLFKKPAATGRESYCFRRTGQSIEVNPVKFPVAGSIIQATRSNALFLSTCAQFNVAEAMRLKDWFREKLIVLSDRETPALEQTVALFEKDEAMRQAILDFIRLVDLGIQRIEVRRTRRAAPSSPMGLGEEDYGALSIPLTSKNPVEIFSVHDVFHGEAKTGEQRLPFEAESEGTKQLFALAGLWFGCLRKGGTLLVDEFGASLHTKLAMELVKLFQQPLNRSAQLVVATHDTNLLRRDLLQRDQIWFTEKDGRGATDLYSLVEYRINQATAVRNDASFGKDYLAGRYGAISHFENVDEFLKDFYSDGDL